jgi:hypothetical protein
MKHPQERDLALYAGGDCGMWGRLRTGRHIAGCEACQRSLEAYRAASKLARQSLGELPEDLDWNALALEMRANIRVGLAAGECVQPVPRLPARLGWRPSLAMAGVVLMAMSAWLLYLPQPHVEQAGAVPAAAGIGMVMQATSTGVELQENGRALTVLHRSSEPLALSVNTNGSVRARYVDADTGQMTITNVYAE